MNELRVKDSILATKQDVLATKADSAALEERLSKKMGGFGSDVFKWMFVFWLGQMAVTFGGIYLFLKK